MPRTLSPEDELLTPGEVARLFGVDVKTVGTWARQDKLPSIKTLGGHRRYPAQVVRAITQRPG